MQNKKILRGYLFVILSAVIFGLMPLMAKFIYAEGVNPPTLVLLRNAVSVPVLAMLAGLTGKSLRIPAKALPGMGVIALLGCCVTPLLLFSSYRHIPSGTATVLHFVYPAVVVVGEILFLKNKMKFGHVLSVVLCVAGIALFYDPSGGMNLKGGALALISGVTYAAYVLCLSGFKHKDMPGFTFSFYVAAICAVVMLSVCLLTKQLQLPGSLKGWLLSAVFAVGVNVGAVVLFQRGTFLIGGSRASILSTFEPITSILAGILVFHENVSAATVLGTVLVIAAGVLIALCDMRASAKTAA